MLALPPACCVTPRAPFLVPDNSLPFPSFSGSAFNSPDLPSLAHRAPGPEGAEYGRLSLRPRQLGRDSAAREEGSSEAEQTGSAPRVPNP